MAARLAGAERADGGVQHRRVDRLERDDGDGLGVAEGERFRQIPVISGVDDSRGVHLPGGQVFRVRGALCRRRGPLAQRLPGHLFHHDGAARAAHHRRHRREFVSLGPRREDVEDTARAVYEPDRNRRLVLALRRPGVDLPVPGFVSSVEDCMDAHATHDMSKHVRTYLMVFGVLMVLTLITVGVSYLHLPTREAIFVALAIATIKGSL